MGVALLLYQIPLPLILLAAIVLRPDAWALCYFPGLILLLVFFPHELLTLQRPIVRAVSIYIATISIIEFISHAVYFIVFFLTTWDLELEVFSWFKYFGLTPGGYLDLLRYLAPPLILFILCVVILVAIDNRNFYPILPPARDKPSSVVYKFFIWVSLLLASVSTPSLISLVYFVFWICVFLAKGVFRKPLSMKNSGIWTPIYLFTGLNILLQILAQQSFLLDTLPHDLRAPIGVQHYTQLEIDWNGLGVVIGWIAIVLLFWAISLHRRNNLLGRKLNGPGPRPAYRDEESKAALNRHPAKKFFVRIKPPIIHLLVEYGRYGTMLSCLIFFIMWPSILSYGLFIILIVASVSDSHRIAKIELVSVLLFYMAFYLTALMCFNTPFSSITTTDTLRNIGFVQRIPNGAWLGFPMILYAVIAVYWSERHILIGDKDLPMGAIARGKPSEEILDLADADTSQSTSVLKSRGNTTADLLDASFKGAIPSTQKKPALFRAESADYTRSTVLVQNVWYGLKRFFWLISIPFVRYSHILAMAGLYFSGLTSVNLINAGYVVFFIFAVLVRRRILQKSWLVLIIYSELAISLIYLWQTTWTIPYDKNFWVKLFGLKHYPDQYSLFWDQESRTGLIWHFVILAFSLVQHNLVKVGLRRENRASTQNVPELMTKFFSIMTYIFYQYGILVCYAALLLVPTYSKKSYINFVYLILLFISLNIHMIVKKFDSSMRHLSRYWLLVCTLSGIIFVARYIAQFPAVNTFLKQYVPSGTGKKGSFGLLDLGLDMDPTPVTELLGNAAVFVSTVFQQKSFYRSKEKIPKEPTLKSAPRIREFFAWVQRFMMLYMVNLTLLTMILVSVQSVTVINMIYLIMVVITIPLKYGLDNIGMFAMLYTQIVILAKLIYQFPARANVAQDSLLQYIGFKEAPNNLLFGGEVAIIALLSIQRIALRWRLEWKLQKTSPFAHMGASSSSVDKVGKVEYPKHLTLFLYDVNMVPQKNFNWYDFGQQVCWYLSNVFEVHKFQFFILALLIGLFTHEDLMAVVFFIIAVISLRFTRTNITRGGPPAKILLAVLTLLMLLQYLFTLDLPDNFGFKYPWYKVDPEAQQWFLVKTNSISNIIADFFVLMVLSGIINAEDSEDFYKSTYYKTMISSFSTSNFEKQVGWFIELRYSILRNSIYWTLLLVFLAGTVEANLLYLGYLIFALVYLYSTNRIYKYRNAHWRYARIYNIIVIFAKLAYQSPLFSANTAAFSWSTIIGLKKYRLSLGQNNIFIVFDIVIFIFLSLQKTILTRAEFGVMVQKMIMEQADGLEDAMERYEKYLENRALKVKKMKTDRLRRRRQLELLKLYRERQQEAWKIAAEGGLSIIDAAKLVDQTSILKTTADIRRLEETGAITYARDAAGKTIMQFNAPQARPMPSKPSVPAVDLSKLSTPSVVVSLDEEDSDEENTKAEQVSAPQSIIPSSITQRFKDIGHEITNFGRRRISRTDKEKSKVASAASSASVPPLPSPKSTPPAAATAAPISPAGLTPTSVTSSPTVVSRSSSHDRDSSDTPPATDRSASSAAPATPTTPSAPPLSSTSSQPLAASYPGMDKPLEEELELTKPTGLFVMAGKLIDQFVKLMGKYTYAKLRKYSGRSRTYQLFATLWQFLATYSQSLVYLFFMLNVIVNNDIISLFYVGTMLFYCLLARPRPSKNYWKLVLFYTSIVLIVKFLFQFSIVCMCYKLDNVITYSIAPECYAKSCNNEITTYINNFPILLGLFKYGDAPNHHPYGDLFAFFNYAIMDILVLVAVLIHRHFLKQFGYWNQWQEQYEFENEHLVVQMSKRDKRILQDKRRSLLQIKLSKKMQNWSKFYSQHRREHLAKIKKQYPDRDFRSFDPVSIANPIFDRSLLHEINEDDVGDSLPVTNPLYNPTQIKDEPGDESSHDNREDSADESDDRIMNQINGVIKSPRRTNAQQTPFGLPEYLNKRTKFDIDYLIWQDRVNEEFVGKTEFKKLGDRLGGALKRVFTSIPKYYRNMFADNPAAIDLYSFIFFAEFLSFFFLMFFPKTVIGTQGLIQFVIANSIPSAWVWSIFAQFVLIILDRVLYSYRAIRLKLLLHYTTVVFYHVLILFILPLINGKDFGDLPELVWFYFFKLVYMVASALQIGYGFPLRIQGQILTKDLETPNPVIMVLFFVYRAIPFVYEIRSILDWTLTATTLTLYEWLKFEDIFAELFLNKCRIYLDRITTRNVGEPVFWYVKLLMGLGVFLLIILLLFLPLFLFMQGTSSSVPNLALEVELSIGFSGYDDIYVSTLTPANGFLYTLTLSQFNSVRRDAPWIQSSQIGGIQVGVLREDSIEPWAISQPSRDALVKVLNSTSPQVMSVFLRWRRPAPETKLWQEYRRTQTLSSAQQAQFLNIVQNPNSGDSAVLSSLFPRYFDIPQSEPVSAFSARGSVSVAFRLNRTIQKVDTDLNGSVVTVENVQDFWSLTEINSTASFFNKRTPQFLSINAEILTGIVSTITSSGIIGFYVSIVLAVGRFLRIALTNLSHKPIYEDMAECEELLSFCMDIYIAREDKDLELEENLWRELIELYRSPERMILRTDPKGKPRFRSHPVKPKKSKKKVLDTPSKAELLLTGSQSFVKSPQAAASPRSSGDFPTKKVSAPRFDLTSSTSKKKQE